LSETSTQLERRAEKARERLMNRLEDFRDHAFPSTIVSGILDLKPETFGLEDATRILVRQVKSNPLAWLLIVAGISWLIVSDNRAGQRGKPRSAHRKTKRHSRRSGRRKAGHG
jgi:hypothetical protein